MANRKKKLNLHKFPFDSFNSEQEKNVEEELEVSRCIEAGKIFLVLRGQLSHRKNVFFFVSLFFFLPIEISSF